MSDDFEAFASGDDVDELSFGQLQNYPWRTPYPFDGSQSPAPRRPELLGDQQDAWWADLTAWTEWAIKTFRLSRWFPTCWLRHPSLVEEAQALWLVWSEAWLPGIDPNAPAHFLAVLAASLHRIETVWQIPCNAGTHSEPTPVRDSVRVRPSTEPWWSLPEFDPSPPSW